MENIYSVLNQMEENKGSKPRMPKEENAKMMKEKREALFQLAQKQCEIIKMSPQEYLNYLNMQGQMDYTVTNTLLIMAQKPNATMLKDNVHWRNEKIYIKKGEKGIQILEPKGEYERKYKCQSKNVQICSLKNVQFYN